MPLLTVSNLRTSPIAFQTDGLAFVSFTVPGSGNTTNKMLSPAQFAALEPQLKTAVTAGHVTWSITDDPASQADDGLGGAGVSGPLGELLEVCSSSAPGSVYANGLQFVPLRQGQADTITVEFTSAVVGALEIVLVYAMSAANNGNVALRTDVLKLSAGDDPSVALVTGTPGVVTPGNDANLHTADATTFSGFAIAGVAKGDFIHCVIARPAAADTHTGDMRVLKVGVRTL